LWGPHGSSRSPLKLLGSLIVQKQSSKSFIEFRLLQVRIFWKTKNMQKIGTGTGHLISRLAQKNNIKWHIKHTKVII
jgi:hypothetical protein